VNEIPMPFILLGLCALGFLGLVVLGLEVISNILGAVIFFSLGIFLFKDGVAWAALISFGVALWCLWMLQSNARRESLKFAIKDTHNKLRATITPTTPSPQGAEPTVKGKTMKPQSPFDTFRGSLVSAIATATTLMVLGFFVFTVWQNTPLDFKWEIDKKSVPPESYPILLLTAWSLLQRAKAHMRPRTGGLGTFWEGEDKYEAWLMVMFMLATLVYAFATNSSLTYLLVLMAFLIQAFGDALMNGRHRYENEALAAGVAGASPEQFEAMLATVVQRLAAGNQDDFVLLRQRPGEKLTYNREPVAESPADAA